MMETSTEHSLVQIAMELTRIRELLQEMTTPDPDPDPDLPICSHPLDQRLALGMTTGWQCQGCGHQEAPS